MSRKPFGSGYFGKWIEDEFGLPAYRYDCDQINDPKAVTRTHNEWRRPTEHLHQVGNDRLVAVASNYGHIQVRQDEGGPKFLNDFAPEHHQYGGGFGYLIDGETILCTYYTGEHDSFERTFGIGYYKKRVSKNSFVVEQIIFAPYGDEPLLISQVRVENQRPEPATVRWIEYWGSQQYQFSMKAFIQATVAKKSPNYFRRELARRFAHNIQVIGENRGIEDSQQFTGEPLGERLKWRLLRFMLHFVGKEVTGGPLRFPVKECALEDLTPPKVFLVSLDAPFDDYSTNASAFFGSGGVESPDGIKVPLSFLPKDDPNSVVGLFLERKLNIPAGGSKTIYFAYGYLLDGFVLEDIITRFSSNPEKLLRKTCEQWKKKRIQLELDDEKWVDRELTWHNYYLRSNLTYDSFFREHILSQGHVYQYIIGFQGAARDPLQHALPFVFTEPGIVKEILRYTLKSVQPDGEIPYGITGAGMRMPSPFRPSDLEMWLLWLASEYVLGTRDLAFLDETVPTYPIYGGKSRTAKVREILELCYHHLTKTTGTGKHGLLRLSNGDWNDAMVLGYVPENLRKEVEEIGESVLNAAMAGYALDIYARMLRFAGNDSLAMDAANYAHSQRMAVRNQWAGKWFKRAWLSEQLGWVGEDNLWLEPQPWAIISGAADSTQKEILVKSIDELVRKPQKYGAMILAKHDPKMEGDPGVGTNGGVWPSINGTLIWAFSLADGKMAWDEWKKNTLAYHADVYPEVWYGIWSGPDTYNSDQSIYPGGTMYGDLYKYEEEDTTDKEGTDDEEKTVAGVFLEISWTDFPVMNMHPHAWPQYTILKLLGIEFTTEGLDIAPALPKDKFRFSSSLLELDRTISEMRGKYSPLKGGEWRIRIAIPRTANTEELKLTVNGKDAEFILEDGWIVFSGESSPETPLEWTLKF